MQVLFDYQFTNSKENMIDQANAIEQKDYCDESQLMLRQYDHRKAIEFKEELGFINGWVNDSSQSSLLITGEPVSGKKTLLHQFLKQNQQQHGNWLFISHFASMTPLYSHILHKTMVALRNHFKIQQKVDINDEKLRRYFKYWLEVTSDFLQKQYLGYNRQEVPKVVIILEGIDLCLDSKGNYVEPQFWLPSSIPPHIKLILTARDNEQLMVNNSIVLRHQLTQDKRDKIIRTYSERVIQLSNKNKDFSLYTLFALNEMIKRKDHFKINKLLLNQVMSEYISHVSMPDLNEDMIRSILYTLILTRKGLKSKEICKIVNIGIQKWEYFFRCFSFLVVEAKGYFLVCNRPAIEAIQKIVDSRHEKVNLYRSSIVKAIKRESVNLRSLEEIVYQLLENETFCELKEVVCRIQNFIMLYTPFSKELLCQCWTRLEQLEQFDPVFEYNKAIQSYASHYYPKEEDLYKIIFQICMFFKEYAEFQNSKTPAFRHPLIKGEADHLQSIGIHLELESLSMVGKCKIYKMKPIEKVDKIATTRIKPDISCSKIQSKEEKERLEPTKTRNLEKRSMAFKNQQESRTYSVKSRRSVKKNQQTFQEDRQQISTPSSSQLNRESDIIEEEKGLNIEELNLSITSNQDKFRHHFLGQMKEYLEKYIVPFKKNTFKQKSLAFQSDESDGDEQSIKDRGTQREFRVDIEKVKDSFVLKQFKEYLQESYHKTGEEVQFYYYKQWIWLQFPWLCQTIKHVYSNMLKECLPGSINFMSPLKEFNLIKDVIKIARSAKQNKLGVYNQKKIEIHCIKSPTSKYDVPQDSGKGKESNIRGSGPITGRKDVQVDTANRYKVNLGSIDEEIYKQKLEETKLRNRGFYDRKTLRGDNSLPNLNLFMTEATNKESRMFPSLKKSKFGMQAASRSKNQKENHQDSRDYTIVIRKFNELKHENQILVEKIEESKRLTLQNTDTSREDTMSLNQSLEDFEVKKQNLQKSHKNQVELRKKLQVIIKICDLNKMYGSETDYLSNYLDNIKKMIDLEESKIKDIKAKIQSDVEEAKITLRDLKTKKKQLKAIQDQLLPPYNSLNTDSTNKYAGEMGLEEIEEELKDMSRIAKNKSAKKGKSTGFKHFYSARDYDIIEIDIGIQYGQDSNEERIQQFADKQEKLKELRLKNADLKRDYLEKKKHIEFILDQSNIQLKGQSREREIRNANLLVERKKELNRIKNRCLLLIHAKSALQPIEIQ